MSRFLPDSTVSVEKPKGRTLHDRDLIQSAACRRACVLSSKHLKGCPLHLIVQSKKNRERSGLISMPSTCPGLTRVYPTTVQHNKPDTHRYAVSNDAINIEGQQQQLKIEEANNNNCFGNAGGLLKPDFGSVLVCPDGDRIGIRLHGRLV